MLFFLSINDLQNTETGDVWGIGRQYAQLLQRHGIRSAYDLTQANESWLHRHLMVVGLRIKMELEGVPCIDLETDIPAKKKHGDHSLLQGTDIYIVCPG